MLTGTLPSHHGVHIHNRSYGSLDPTETFLSELSSHRITGVSSNAFAGSPSGFDRFFDSFTDVTATRRFHTGLDPAEFGTDGDGCCASRSFLRAALGHDHPIRSLGNGVTGFLDRLFEETPISKPFDDGAASVIRAAKSEASVEEPFFLFTSFMEAHSPLRPMLGFDRQLYDPSNGFLSSTRSASKSVNTPDHHRDFLEPRRALSSAAIDYLDRRLASFVDWLTANTDLPTTVVITAAHGENQGDQKENRLVRPKSSLSEGRVHVPLLVIDAPAGLNGCERRFISHLDLGELLVGLANGTVPDMTREWVPAELIGMSAAVEPSLKREYLDRVVRAVYDGRTPTDSVSKVVWDSCESVERYTIDPKRPCCQRQTASLDEIPRWATEQFGVPIEEANRQAMRAENSEVPDAVQARLETLGYPD